MYPGCKVYGLILLFKKNKKIHIGYVCKSPSAPSLDNCEISLKTIIDEMVPSVSPKFVSGLIIIGDFNLSLVT